MNTCENANIYVVLLFFSKNICAIIFTSISIWAKVRDGYAEKFCKEGGAMSEIEERLAQVRARIAEA